MKFTLRSLALVALLGFVSCEKDDPEEILEQEVISNFTLTLTPEDDHDEVSEEDHDHDEEVIVFHWHDGDGDGEIDYETEVEQGGELEKNTTYHATISLNEDEDEDEHEHDDEDGHEHNDEDEHTAALTEESSTNKINSLNNVLSGDHDHEHGEDVDLIIATESNSHLFFFETPTGLTVESLDKDNNGEDLGVESDFITDENYNGGDITITLLHEPEDKSKTILEEIGGVVDIEITFNLGVHLD